MKTLLVMLGIVVGTVCWAATPEPMEGDAHIDWGAEIEGCRFSVSASRGSFRCDEPVQLRLLVQNVGTKPVNVMHSSLLVDFKFDVRLPNGKSAPLTLEGNREGTDAASAMAPHRLNPGATDSQGVPMLNRLYDMTVAGEYSITVRRYFIPAGEKRRVEVSSNTLKIVVRDVDASEDRRN